MMHKLNFEQFKEYLKTGRDEKRAFDLDGVLNTVVWDDSEPYDGDYDELSDPGIIRQGADSTAFLHLLRPGDCVVTARPTHWVHETLKWLSYHGCRTNNVHLRNPAFFKSSKEQCIKFKVSVISSWGIGIYLDDEKSIAEAVQKELPSVIACYIDWRGEDPQIVVNY
jgi:hypothetical protein